MSLQPSSIGPVPELTSLVARAALRTDNPYAQLREEFATLYADPDFAYLYPCCGQPAWAPWRLALVTIFQFMQQLSDRQAAETLLLDRLLVRFTQRRLLRARGK